MLLNRFESIKTDLLANSNQVMGPEQERKVIETIEKSMDVRLESVRTELVSNTNDVAEAVNLKEQLKEMEQKLGENISKEIKHSKKTAEKEIAAKLRSDFDKKISEVQSTVNPGNQKTFAEAMKANMAVIKENIPELGKLTDLGKLSEDLKLVKQNVTTTEKNGHG